MYDIHGSVTLICHSNAPQRPWCSRFRHWHFQLFYTRQMELPVGLQKMTLFSQSIVDNQCVCHSWLIVKVSFLNHYAPRWIVISILSIYAIPKISYRVHGLIMSCRLCISFVSVAVQTGYYLLLSQAWLHIIGSLVQPVPCDHINVTGDSKGSKSISPSPKYQSVSLCEFCMSQIEGYANIVGERFIKWHDLVLNQDNSRDDFSQQFNTFMLCVLTCPSRHKSSDEAFNRDVFYVIFQLMQPQPHIIIVPDQQGKGRWLRVEVARMPIVIRSTSKWIQGYNLGS